MADLIRFLILTWCNRQLRLFLWIALVWSIAAVPHKYGSYWTERQLLPPAIVLKYTLASLLAGVVVWEASRLEDSAEEQFEVRLAARELRRKELAYRSSSYDLRMQQEFGLLPALEEAIEVPYQAVPQQGESETEEAIAGGDEDELPLFEVSRIQDPDFCPCIAIIGVPGTGKSTLIKYLIQTQFPGSEVIVFDPEAEPHDWQGYRVLGKEWQTDEILDQLEADQDQIQQRGRLINRGGKAQLQQTLRIVEEAPTLIESCKPKKSSEDNPVIGWLLPMVRLGRKRRMRVFLVSQEWSVRALGLEGLGSLRRSFARFYLAEDAYEAIRSLPPLLRSKTKAWLDEQERPCIVGHRGRLYRFLIPQLATAQPIEGSRSTQTDIRRLLEWMDEEES
jgi:hypothetical protein